MAHPNSTCVSLSLSGVVCYGVFFNFKKSPDFPLGVNCSSIDNFDPDVAGIGVMQDPPQLSLRRLLHRIGIIDMLTVIPEEKDRKNELDSRSSSSYTFIVDPEQSPHVPRRPVRKRTQSSLYGDESELSLLSSSGQRQDSDTTTFSPAYCPERSYARHGSQSSAVGIGIRFDDNQYPSGRGYSLGSSDFQPAASMGWPSGYGTGIDEGQSSPNARR